VKNDQYAILGAPDIVFDHRDTQSPAGINGFRGVFRCYAVAGTVRDHHDLTRLRVCMVEIDCLQTQQKMVIDGIAD